jgi:Tol biopolymer transport system component
MRGRTAMKVPRIFFPLTIAAALAIGILACGDGDGGRDTVFHTGITRVSVASDGTEANDISWARSISGDGQYVAFISKASNLVAGDNNNRLDAFVHDRLTGETTRVSVASDGTRANRDSAGASISGDGRYVAFYSFATNLVARDTNDREDVFVHDRITGETTRVSVASDGTQGRSHSFKPSISGDGRYVAFYSRATNLVGGDTNGVEDIFVHDRVTGETTRVSVASDGTEGDSYSHHRPSISEDGRYVAFESSASNLVTDDSNGQRDVFVHDRLTAATTRVSVALDGTEGNNWSRRSSISADGRYVAFESWASNLVAGDTNGQRDVFLMPLGPRLLSGLLFKGDSKQ